jgi:hypothetical protein
LAEKGRQGQKDTDKFGLKEQRMNFPLSFDDISLWLAVVAMVLLITSELMLPYSGRNGLLLNKRRLKNVSLAVGVLFVAIVVVRVITILTSR